MCGENPLYILCPAHTTGSPPRVRGKLKKSGQNKGKFRITPACAGKTTTLVGDYGVKKDHPRVCGENDDSITRVEYEEGSPPRVRGKPICLLILNSLFRITPACAGKTRLPSIVELSGKDHPRVCGENTIIISSILSNLGSPPRVRGKLVY